MATKTRTSVDLMPTSNLPSYFSCISSTMRQIYVFFLVGVCCLTSTRGSCSSLLPPFFFFSFPSCFYARQTDVHRPFLFVVCSFFFVCIYSCVVLCQSASLVRVCVCAGRVVDELQTQENKGSG